jgi:MFS family permease
MTTAIADAVARKRAATVSCIILAGLVAAALLFPTTAHAQTALFDTRADTTALSSIGWRGFLDTHAMLEELAALALATVLGALIAFHPMTPRTVDTLKEAEMPKVYIMYAIVGAVIGVTVLTYGLVVGLVVFGLGGIMRFRTDTGSTRDTGRLIVVTLIGLICGLNLPHFAVLAAVFVYLLIFLLDAYPLCRIVIKELPSSRVTQAADTYRAVLTQLGCKVLSERKHYAKPCVEIVFRAPRRSTPDALDDQLCKLVPVEVRGEIDWEVD